MTKKHTPKWWDEFWAKGTNHFGAPRAELLKWAAAALKEEGRPYRALDAGSGNGRYALPLAKLGFRVTAVDKSQAACSLIKKHLENPDIPAGRVEVLCQDFTDVSVDSAHRPYDLVLSSGLLEEVEPDLQAQTVVNLQKLTAGGGLLILKFCLEISERGITVPEGYVLKFFSNVNWKVLEHASDPGVRPSIANISFEKMIRTETIIARKEDGS